VTKFASLFGKRSYAVGRGTGKARAPPPRRDGSLAVVPEATKKHEMQPHHRGEDGAGASLSYGVMGAIGLLLATAGCCSIRLTALPPSR